MVNRGRNNVVIGGAVILLGACLPWMELKTGEFVWGWQTVGLATGAVGILFILVGLFYRGRPGRAYLPALGILALALFAWQAYQAANLLADMFFGVGDRGMFILGGMPSTLLGLFLAVLGGFRSVPAQVPA